MRPRHPLPRTWLLTDERQGDALWTALRRLPRGSGVIVRHYSLKTLAREKLFRRIRSIARTRGLTLCLSGSPKQARRWGADGSYAGSPEGKTSLVGVHGLKEIRQAERGGAVMVMLSPLFPTRSHLNARSLGIPRFAALARATRLPVIALGGVDARHTPLLNRIGAYGWAGIDAFSPKAEKGRIRI